MMLRIAEAATAVAFLATFYMC